MNHHAYFFAGDTETGITNALSFGKETLGLTPEGNPDVTVLCYASFPVEEARKIADITNRIPVLGDKKLVVIATSRIFHEAQNALLKVFEEPPAGTYLILIVPSEGDIIPTLRSRLLVLPGERTTELSPLTQEFLNANAAGKEKIVEKLLARTKSDTQDEKQQARGDALQLAEGLMRAAYAGKRDPETLAFLSDLAHFIPILHERSAPLKPIFEHLLLTLPAGLPKGGTIRGT